MECEWGTISGHIDFEPAYELNEMEQHYLFEIVGMLIHKNVMFDNKNAENLFYVVLEPMLVQYQFIQLWMYHIMITKMLKSMKNIGMLVLVIYRKILVGIMFYIYRI